ncbi:MAG TPA: lipopolysaccharide transport periplasmic protein LptA [Steroidobacteraceae bacterium]|jgi:lipopolysaccharide transport protein LptA|nr:lipopolysaccharide transport periplasmic protein LptA [Steroidobacteraceae bacterium]
MAASTPRSLSEYCAWPALALLALALLAPPASAAVPAKAEPQTIVLDAQSFEMDLKTNNLIYRKVRIAQGNMSVAADQAQGNGLDFENSHWVFRGNVKITMDQGLLTSDEAEITFAKKLLSKAVVNGKPAAFEQRIAKTGKLAQGHADSIDYDVTKEVVHLSKNAWLSDGEREIQGESLKYNVLAQNIIADASEQGSQRVHIIITPPAKPKP